MSDKKDDKPTPIIKKRQGSLSVSVWANENGTSFTLQKSWRKDGDFHNRSLTLFPNDVPMSIECLNQAWKEYVKLSEIVDSDGST